jgi:hypothetical protein
MCYSTISTQNYCFYCSMTFGNHSWNCPLNNSAHVNLPRYIYGWACPRCYTINSPNKSTCDCVSHSRGVTTNISGDYKRKSIEKYPMCEPQPAQIDCRITACVFHKNASCINPAPAITLMENRKQFTCWSEELEELE